MRRAQVRGLPPPGGVQLGALRREERRHERHHHHAVAARHGLEHVVGDVPRDVAEGARRRVREDHRGLAHLEGLAHRVGGRVTEVHQHAGPVQLADHLLAESCEAAVGRGACRGIRPRIVVVVGEREVAHPEPGEEAQGPEGASDRLTALDADHRSHPPRGGDALDIGGAARELHPLRIAPDQVQEGVDLLERGGDGLVPGQIRRHVDRPELPSNASGFQPHEVRLELRSLQGEVGHRPLPPALQTPLPERPQQVVVPIDQRRGSQQVAHALLDGVGHPAMVAAPGPGAASGPVWLVPVLRRA